MKKRKANESRLICDVCCDTHRNLTTCAHCEHSICRACTRKILVDNAASSCCPSCHAPWDTQELCARVGSTFYGKEYRRAREQYWLMRETARLTGTMQAAKRERRRRLLVREMHSLMQEIREGRHDLIPEYHEVTRMLLLLQEQHTVANHSQRERTMRCAHAACDGFVNHEGGCLKCGGHTCFECGVEIDRSGTHTCDPMAVASMQLIANECRPCARCAAPSTRVEGCPVMWCAHCHTFWNWDTGRIIDSRRTPHNPDHREWLASSSSSFGPPRELDDLPCGGLPEVDALHEAFTRDLVSDPPMDVHVYISYICEAMHALHVAQRLRHEYPSTWNDLTENEHLRIAFLLGDIDEMTFGNALERHERMHIFKRDIAFVLEALVLSGIDILQCFCASDDCVLTSIRLNALCTLVNDALQRIAGVHKRVPPRLSPNWVWTLPHRQRRLAR